MPAKPSTSPRAETKTRAGTRSRGRSRPNTEVNFDVSKLKTGKTTAKSGKTDTFLVNIAEEKTTKINNPFEETKGSEDVFVSTIPQETKYSMDFVKLTCNIQVSNLFMK